MGRRSRKQRDPARTGARPQASPPAAPRAPLRERPRAPWHPVPLVELCVLVGIVLIVVGFFSMGDRRGGLLIVSGLALGSLAGLDTVVREHFAGFKSHTLALAGVPTVTLAGILYFSRAPIIVVVLGAVLAFVGAFAVFRRAFQRSSGGLSFR